MEPEQLLSLFLASAGAGPGVGGRGHLRHNMCLWATERRVTVSFGGEKRLRAVSFGGEKRLRSKHERTGEEGGRSCVVLRSMSFAHL